MTWANVHAGLVAAIEGLTPQDSTVGAPEFRHLIEPQEDVENAATDRAFEIRAVSRRRVEEAATINTTYLTEVEVIVLYLPTASVEQDEQRIGQDYETITGELELPSSIHAEVWAVGQAMPATKTEDESGIIMQIISLELTHA